MVRSCTDGMVVGERGSIIDTQQFNNTSRSAQHFTLSFYLLRNQVTL